MPFSLRLVPTEPGQSRYAALAAAMRARIVAGEWPPGTGIPAFPTYWYHPNKKHTWELKVFCPSGLIDVSNYQYLTPRSELILGTPGEIVERHGGWMYVRD